MDKTIEELCSRLKEAKKHRILFVCLGNICRSPAAQGIMQQIVDQHHAQQHWELDSAGLYGGHAGQLPDKRMRVHATRRGYNLTHHSRPISITDFDKFDLIIGMDASNISRLKEMAPSPEAEKKVVAMMQFASIHPHYDYIPDPYYEGAEGFELVLDLLEDACLGLFNALS